MLLNYLKLAFRLLLRNPFFTFINILGLSVGFAAFFILWPYAQSELKSDQFHQDHERIARLTWHQRWTDNNQDWIEFDNAINFCGVGKQIADEFSEVKTFTRFVPQGAFRIPEQGISSKVFFSIFENDSTKKFFHEENTAFTDANFFEFFSFPLELGDASNVLSQPSSVVISHQHRIKYFGNTAQRNENVAAVGFYVMKLIRAGVLSVCLILVVYVLGFSQCKDMSLSATGEAIERIALFEDAYKAKKFTEAKGPLNWLLQNAPKLNTNLYIKAVDTYDALANSEKKPEQRSAYMDSVMIVYDLRIKNCGEEPNVTNRKAISFFNYHYNNPSRSKEILPLMDKAIIE